MQGEEKRPATSGRPSLLSTAPPVDTGRASILDGLERRPASAAAPASQRRGRRQPWLIGGAAALLLAVLGVATWMNVEPDRPLTLPPAAELVAQAPPAAPAPAAAATLVEESAAVSPPADNTRSLKDMLNDAPAKPPKDELTAALEKPHTVPAKSRPKKPLQAAKKAEPKAKPAPQDNDVALLAALITHVQSGKQGKETSTPAYQLKQCSRMNDAGAAQCREHLCASTARKEPECKQPAVVKTAAES